MVQARREYLTVATDSGAVVTTFRTATSGSLPAVPTASAVSRSARRVEGSTIRTASRVKTFMTASGVLRTLVGPTVTATLPRTETVLAGAPQESAALSSVPRVVTVAIGVPLVSEVVPIPEPPITRSVFSVQSRHDSSTFMSISVLPKTNRVYSKEWRSWKTFVKAETGSDDLYLIGVSDDEKAALVALLMMRKHRVSESTYCELGNQDHCARVDDLTFSVEVAGVTEYITGSGLVEIQFVDSF